MYLICSILSTPVLIRAILGWTWFNRKQRSSPEPPTRLRPTSLSNNKLFIADSAQLRAHACVQTETFHHSPSEQHRERRSQMMAEFKRSYSFKWKWLFFLNTPRVCRVVYVKFKTPSCRAQNVLRDVYVAMEMNLKDSKQDIISTPLNLQ